MNPEDKKRIAAEAAVDLSAPHMRLMTWLEHNRDDGRAHDLIRLMGQRRLDELWHP